MRYMSVRNFDGELVENATPIVNRDRAGRIILRWFLGSEAGGSGSESCSLVCCDVKWCCTFGRSCCSGVACTMLTATATATVSVLVC
jgi:hypothetical protein